MQSAKSHYRKWIKKSCRVEGTRSLINTSKLGRYDHGAASDGLPRARGSIPAWIPALSHYSPALSGSLGIALIIMEGHPALRIAGRRRRSRPPRHGLGR